jgi:hypothetical protein
MKMATSEMERDGALTRGATRLARSPPDAAAEAVPKCRKSGA